MVSALSLELVVFLEIDLEEIQDTALDVRRPWDLAVIEADVVHKTIGVAEEDWLLELLLMGRIELDFLEDAEWKRLAWILNIAVRFRDANIRQLKAYIIQYSCCIFSAIL